jgi:hypothetical protein
MVLHCTLKVAQGVAQTILQDIKDLLEVFFFFNISCSLAHPNYGIQMGRL